MDLVEGYIELTGLFLQFFFKLLFWKEKEKKTYFLYILDIRYVVKRLKAHKNSVPVSFLLLCSRKSTKGTSYLSDVRQMIHWTVEWSSPQEHCILETLISHIF